MKWFPTLTASAIVLNIAAIAATVIPAEVRTNGFALGTQSYTFKEFTFEEACAKTAAAGLHTTELFPGQKISASLPDQKTGPGVSPEGLKAIKDILKKNNIQAVAIGVIGIPVEEEAARKVFSFAKELGIGVINTESTNAIDTIEKMVKEFDIKVGYHNHPRRPNDENYKVWDPNYILELTKDLAAADCIRILKGRVVSSHIKDIAKGGTSVVPAGTGRANLGEALTALKEVGFSGPISIEHENNWKDNVGDVITYVDLVKAHGK
jgi:sugar phosphate isomerase/epimerase